MASYLENDEQREMYIDTMEKDPFCSSALQVSMCQKYLEVCPDELEKLSKHSQLVC